jgi:hypothetical protein
MKKIYEYVEPKKLDNVLYFTMCRAYDSVFGGNLMPIGEYVFKLSKSRTSVHWHVGLTGLTSNLKCFAKFLLTFVRL